MGKTAISLYFAEEISAEIISCDSMQVYRGMDIGTAKATKSERERIPHHLLDIIEPGASFSVSVYQGLARTAIADITSRGKLPLLVGGSGLYLRAALMPYDFTPEEVDESFRAELYRRAEGEGASELYRELETIDPEAAAKLHVNDTKRIVRALEVYYISGERISEYAKKTANAKALYDISRIGLDRERASLYRRIDARVDAMITEGLVEEVRLLYRSGVIKKQGSASTSTSGQALGYKELIPYIEGQISLEVAVANLKQATRRYATRQLTWFRREEGINWYHLDEDDSPGEIARRIADGLRDREVI